MVIQHFGNLFKNIFFVSREAIFKKAVERSGITQAESILELVIGANEHAEWLADDKHINLVH